MYAHIQMYKYMISHETISQLLMIALCDFHPLHQNLWFARGHVRFCLTKPHQAPNDTNFNTNAAALAAASNAGDRHGATYWQQLVILSARTVKVRR